jgi:hypothetical protein
LRAPRVDEHARDFGVERRTAGVRGADAREHLFRIGVLQEITDRAGLERVEDALLVCERREYHDMQVSRFLGDLSRRFDAVEHGHRQIHQHDVGSHVGDE